MREAALPLPGTIRAGAVAGVAGGIAIDAYLLLVYVAVGHVTTVDGFFRHVAAGAIGSAAQTLPGAAWLGVVLHFAVSIAWGIGYAYVAARTPQVRARPLVSGLAFGLVVMIAMALIEFAAAIWQLPTANEFAHLFVAHLIFFGLPVAYVVSRAYARP